MSGSVVSTPDQTHLLRRCIMDTLLPHAQNGNPLYTSHSEMDLAYLAGLIDGEGCFDIHTDNRNNSSFPRIRVEMTHRETVEWIQQIFPGVKMQSIHRANRNHSDTYRWCVQGPKAITVARLIIPYLKGKRYEAELMLSFPYPDQKPGYNRPLSQDIVDRRKHIHDALREYKTKGKGLIKNE